jgi:hypothetical protein
MEGPLGSLAGEFVEGEVDRIGERIVEDCEGLL